MVQVLPELLRRRRREREVVMNDGERRILCGRLLEELAGILVPKLFGEVAPADVEGFRFVGGARDRNLCSFSYVSRGCHGRRRIRGDGRVSGILRGASRDY